LATTREPASSDNESGDDGAVIAPQLRMNRASGNDPPTRKSILLVDDDDDMREAICAVLSPKYDMVQAIDGIDGCAKAQEKSRLDLIITDVSMPQLDGFEMVRRIRAANPLWHVPVIFLTGQMSVAYMVAGLAVGTFAYLAKPTDPELLEKKVKRALGG
jgi:CheY-like chemotaxis protein